MVNLWQHIHKAPIARHSNLEFKYFSLSFLSEKYSSKLFGIKLCVYNPLYSTVYLLTLWINVRYVKCYLILTRKNPFGIWESSNISLCHYSTLEGDGERHTAKPKMKPTVYGIKENRRTCTEVWYVETLKHLLKISSKSFYQGLEWRSLASLLQVTEQQPRRNYRIL